jgi:hypothetical protein
LETPVEITAAVLAQLQVLCGEPLAADRLAAALSQLGRDVVDAVPSCLFVSILPVRLGEEIIIGTQDGADAASVRASLAVPLSASQPSDVLIVRAADPGAFLMLSDGLAGLLGPDHPPLDVDRHRGPPSAGTDESLASAVADLQAVNRAMGVLIARGLPPEAAGDELHRLGEKAEVNIGAAARGLLGSLPTAGGARRA